MSAKTILVADDETHILHVVSMKLKNAGFNVLTASDGQEALEIALAELAPELLELVSVAVLHRFHSRDWMEYLQAKTPLEFGFRFGFRAEGPQGHRD